MQDKISIGFSTVLGILLGVAGLTVGVAGAIADAKVGGLPPSWSTGIGVASLWITKVGRYAQAAAVKLRQARELFGWGQPLLDGVDVPGDTPAPELEPVQADG